MDTSTLGNWSDNDALANQLYCDNIAPDITPSTASNEGISPQDFAALCEGNYPYGLEDLDDINRHGLGIPYHLNGLGESAAPLEGGDFYGPAVPNESNGLDEVAAPLERNVLHVPEGPNDGYGLGEVAAPHEGNFLHRPVVPHKDNVPQGLGGPHQNDAALSLPINEQLPALTDIRSLLMDDGSTPSSSNRLLSNGK